MGQAAGNEVLADDFKDDPLSCHCALATGTGTDLQPITGLKSHLVLSKPNIGVSTAEVYHGIDNMEITEHPDNNEMIEALKKNDTKVLKKNLINVLENFTLNHYPIVMYTKNMMQELCSSGCVLMSGSGPSVFGIFKEEKEARAAYEKLAEANYAKQLFVTGFQNGEGLLNPKLYARKCFPTTKKASGLELHGNSDHRCTVYETIRGSNKC